jgi:hypothetical protein
MNTFKRIALGCAWSLVLAIGLGEANAQPVQPRGDGGSCPRTWMRDRHVGVSTHYFAQNPSELNELASSFDVARMARQAEQASAGWFMFSLQHQNWLMMAPNRTFAQITGTEQFAAKRDVAADLIRELKKVNITPMIYVNIRIDPESGTDPRVRNAMGAWPPDDRLIDNIAAVYREFSLRYGRDVGGWWVDGAGNPAYAESPNRERWFSTIAAALRAGNPNALVSFSPGLHLARYSRHNDYIAGESSDLLGQPPNGPCQEGVQWHMWTYLGGWWGADGTRFSDSQLCRYIAQTVSRGGAITLDVGTWGVKRNGIKGARVADRKGGFADRAQIEQVATVLHALQAHGFDAGSCPR